MSADFWAGYMSGALGIIVGNPLDLIKVRLQATRLTSTINTSPVSYTSQFTSAGSLIRGSTAPILGYGALNALLFISYNRTSDFLNKNDQLPPNLWTTWTAGAIGGLATWVVSTPTELVKCRAQLSSSSSWAITKEIIRREGVRGLYFGGVVTALRDSIGYGFYFWSYQLSTRYMLPRIEARGAQSLSENSKVRWEEAAKVLLCGGLAGVVTWVSIFPLDVIKTRVQTQVLESGERAPLLDGAQDVGRRRLGAIDVTKNAYRTEGVGVFFRGLAVCSIRAFLVNAVQWAVYEWIMRELDPARAKISTAIREQSSTSTNSVKI
jgi:solute carrier family 25 carnitine/acylcarnitine transporter 20/29